MVARDETRFGIDRKTAWHIRVVPASASERMVFRTDACSGNCRGCSYRQGMNGGDQAGSITLDSIAPGSSAIVLRVRGAGGRPSRLMDIGISPGTRLTLVGSRTSGEGLLIKLGERELSISDWDAFHVLVEEDN